MRKMLPGGMGTLSSSVSAGHEVVALLVVGGDAAFVAKGDLDAIPGRSSGGGGPLPVDGGRGASAGEGDSENAALGNGLAGGVEDEAGGVGPGGGWRISGVMGRENLKFENRNSKEIGRALGRWREFGKSDFEFFLRPAYMTMPPSTVRVWPVIYRASGPARKATAAAMSSGSPKRPRGIRRGPRS